MMMIGMPRSSDARCCEREPCERANAGLSLMAAGASCTPRYTSPKSFSKGVLAVVLADRLAFDPVQIHQAVHLEAVPGGDHAVVAPLTQLVDDGLEERHVGGIVEVDPDLLLLARRQGFPRPEAFPALPAFLLPGFLYMARHVPRQRLPVLPLVGCFDVIEQ